MPRFAAALSALCSAVRSTVGIVRSPGVSVVAVCAALLSFGVGGCVSHTAGASLDRQLASIRSSPTPELSTLAGTPDRLANDRAVLINYSRRSMRDAWRRLWLLDRPSPLRPGIKTY